jgi:hypothetical protein
MPNAAAADGTARGGKAGGGKGGAGSGGGKGSGNRPRQGDWACFLCGFQSNRDFRGRCWNCDALRSASLEQAFGSYAQRQLQQQKQAQGQQQQQQRQPKRGGGNGGTGSSSASAECKELREKLDKLQAELAATKALAARGGATVDAADADEDEEMGDEGECDYAAWTEEERTKRLELARGGLAYAAACHGEESPQATEFRATIASLQKASREAKPFKAHRNLLERRRDELRRRQERDEAAISRTQSEMAELQSKLDGLKAAVEERARAITSVTDELSELVLKTLAEEGGGDDKKASGVQAGSPWAAVSAALQPLAGQPGMPPEVAALLTQLQHIAEACTKAAAASVPQQAAAQPSAGETQPTAAGVAAGGQPNVLAPQWRRGKPAARSSPLPHQLQHSDPTAAAATLSAPQAAAAAGETTRQGGGGADGDGTTTRPCPATPPADGGATAAAATVAAAAAAATAGAGAARTQGSSSDDELVEATEDSAMQVDIEESISKLPARDQRRLRAALRMGGGGGGRSAGGGGGDEGTGAEEDSRRQERERSPRPTKTGDKDI